MFGAVKCTKNADVDKYKYFVYGIGFDGKGVFSHRIGGFSNNSIIFGVDVSPSVHIDNKKRQFYSWERSNTRIRGGFINSRENALILVQLKRACLSLHYNGANRYLLENSVEITKFKAKNSEIIRNVLCLGIVLKNFSTDNMKKKTRLYGTVYDFSVDYGAISVDNILNIHKYSIKKRIIV